MRIDVVAAILRRQGQILITQRLDNVHLARLWEFPGGKVEACESFEGALVREIREELGIKIRVDDEFFTIDHDYPTRSVCLHFFNCTVLEGEAKPIEVADLRWINPQDLDKYQFPPADAELILKLQSRV
jgi:8-oxo-dGTP diphosphatase